MFTAIAAVVAAIVGIVGNIINSNAASLQAMLYANQANVDFARNKEMAYYDAYSNMATILGVIFLAGVLLIGIIYIINK